MLTVLFSKLLGSEGVHSKMIFREDASILTWPGEMDHKYPRSVILYSCEVHRKKGTMYYAKQEVNIENSSYLQVLVIAHRY